jgi:hypothetical protein
MKSLIIIIFCFLSTKSYCQFDKPFSLITSVNLDFKLKGLATNEAGLGINIDAILFAKHKLQLLVETSGDQFIGDKTYIVDAQGRENKTATIYTINAGPQFFVSKTFALSTTTGPAWHSIEDIGFTRDYGFKFAVTGFLGHKRKLVSRIFMVNILKNNLNIQYFGLQLGFRLL